jgi:hypothetical protein
MIDLYAVGTGEEKCKPFEHWITIQGPKGENVHVKALFNWGVMVSAKDSRVWRKNEHRMGSQQPSRRSVMNRLFILLPEPDQPDQPDH